MSPRPRHGALRRVGTSIVALILSCAPVRSIDLSMPEGTQTVVFVHGGSGSDAVTVRSYAVDEAPPQLISLADATSFVVALFYTASIEALALEPADDHTIGVAVVPSARDSWPLPRALEMQTLASGGLSAGDIATRLARVEIVRPPCHELYNERVPFATYAADVSFAVPLGSGVLFGVAAVAEGDDGATRRVVERPRVFFVDADATVEDLTSKLTVTPTVGTLPEPRGFVDREGAATVLWGLLEPNGLTVRRFELVELAADRSVTSVLTTTAATHLEPHHMAAGREGDRRTVLMADDIGDIRQLDEAAASWSTVMTHPRGVVDACSNFYSGILELDDLAHGVAAFRSGPIRTFDLSIPANPLMRSRDYIDASSYCSSAHATLESGAQVAVVASQSSDRAGKGVVYWRPGAENDWKRLELASLVDAKAIMPRGRDLMLSSPSSQAVQLDYDPRRPEIAPRECGLLQIGTSTLFGVTNGDAVFALGAGARDVVIVRRR